ncbi:MAG: DUF488 domain-containing protein [Candidatus Nomurabacteria bacterium]|jgi:uncharacterized protein YeaO (DUF488 family)|nr:DUF488 domain-containing protein [Candidatus Nomurabacteria bacterium]
MNIKSKSIHAVTGADDGIRICIMRRVKPEYDFNIWLPELSPSDELLEDYNTGRIDWDGYVPRFTAEVLDNPTRTKYFEIVRDIAKKYPITLLCHEDTDEKCHRRLVIEKIATLEK